MFENRLRQARLKANLTQKQIASKLFISQQAYGRYENGTAAPNTETLARICEILNVTSDYLLGREGDSDTSKPSEDITFDDFTFAFHNETSSLTEAEKELLLSMARKLNEAKKSGRKAD